MPVKLPNAVSMPQMAISGPAGTPNRFSSEENSAALAAFIDLPRAAIVVRAALGHELVEAEFETVLAAVGGDGAGRIIGRHQCCDGLGPDAVALGLLAKTLFQFSKPALFLPHGAASAGPAASKRTAATSVAQRECLKIMGCPRSLEGL